jgi:capsular exopolysaccharide synthesis family protein
MHIAQTASIRVVMVTSAGAGEGKTSLASHLAVSLARAGQQTLLVDADMRKPTLHKLFGLPLTPGLAELLKAECGMPEAVRAVGATGLRVCPAGAVDGQALAALAKRGAGEILQAARKEFDFVIVDSCPILPVADSLLVGQHVDGVVFSVLRDVSRIPKVLAASQRLTMLGIPVVGAVVSGTTEDVYAYDYD